VNSLDNETLKESLRVLKPGGKLISISGPPDPAFAGEIGKPWILRSVMRVLSHRIRKAAKCRQVSYSFLFVRASGDQLGEITSLVVPGSSSRSWTGSSPLNRPTKPWRTSRKDAPKARSSSRLNNLSHTLQYASDKPRRSCHDRDHHLQGRTDQDH
jgi:hypothetical protein